MRTWRYEDDGCVGRGLIARMRKSELVSSKEVNCGHCRYHRGENRTYHSRNSDPRKLKKRLRGR